MRLLTLRESGALDLVTANEDLYTTPYAILSHTWGAPDEEVTFEDIRDGSASRKNLGYQKVTFCLQRAKRDGLSYVWIDTCCIDKSDPAELGAAINSMYQWFHHAAVCYAYLTDIFDGSTVAFAESRWFKRGWTLQELIAPRKVSFFARDGAFIGTRENLKHLLSAITSVPQIVLSSASLDYATIPQRFRWALNRTTTRPEDMSHCLVGLLGVTMVLQYGIGARAAQQALLEQVTRVHGEARAMEIKQLMTGQTLKPDERDAPESDIPVKQLLQFDDMDTRSYAIDRASYGTCVWLLQHPHFLQWKGPRENSTAFLWILGHPGAGKSTLMKYIVSETVDDWNSATISFYFNARGAQLERSTIGMYRSLLYQILRKDGRLDHVAAESLRNHADVTLHRLKHAFHSVILASRLHTIRCFVDALDECELAEVRDMIVVLQSIAREVAATSRQFDVCLASRYYPALSIRGSLELRLEDQEQQKQDLKRYVSDQLDVDHLSEGDYLRQQLFLKAKGIFMWAHLAVRSLNNEIVSGRSSQLIALLNSLPEELDEMYRAIINRRDDATASSFRICMRWILFSSRPLTSLEFHCALAFEENEYPDDLTARIFGCLAKPTKLMLQRRVSSVSRGLAEIVDLDYGYGRVQVIHESVRDFFIKHHALHDLLPQTVADNPSAWCHDQLKETCFAYLKWKSKLSDTPNSVSLHDYAARYLLHHAEQAAAHIIQDQFVEDLERALLHGELDKFATHYTPCVGHVESPKPDAFVQSLSAAHYFALTKSTRLMATAARLQHDLNIHVKSVGTPLRLSNGHQIWNISHQLLVYGVGLDTWLDGLGRILPHPPNGYKYDYMNSARQDAQIYWAPSNAKVVEGYSARIDKDTVLVTRSPEDFYEAVKMFVLYGSNVNVQDESGRTPLMLACRHFSKSSNQPKQLSLIKWLLQQHADVRVVDNLGMTALHHGCRNFNFPTEAIELLLAEGIHLDATTSHGRTPLMLACSDASERQVRLLLNRGVSVDLKDDRGQTALIMFVRRTLFYGDSFQKEIMLRLLEHNADVEARDNKGHSALDYAQRQTSQKARNIEEHLKTALLLKWLVQEKPKARP